MDTFHLVTDQVWPVCHFVLTSLVRKIYLLEMFYISDPGCYELTRKMNTITVKPESTSNENVNTLSFSTVDVWVIRLINMIVIHVSSDKSLTIICLAYKQNTCSNKIITKCMRSIKSCLFRVESVDKTFEGKVGQFF